MRRPIDSSVASIPNSRFAPPRGSSHILSESCPELGVARATRSTCAARRRRRPPSTFVERDIERRPRRGHWTRRGDVDFCVVCDFDVTVEERCTAVIPPTSRPDVRSGVAGRADVIEEVARLYGYRRLPRHTPTWPEPGGLNERQKLRRHVRDVRGRPRRRRMLDADARQ